MTLGFRRILFGIFVLLFVVIGIGAIYYSQGYRFDISKLAIQKTGAVYIETNQSGVSIYLNDVRYSDKSGILQKGTLISNILPKRYRVIISKDGYFDYEKNIQVTPSEVVRLLNITLVPKQITSTAVIDGVKGDVIADALPDNSRIITLDTQKGIYYLYALSGTPASAINLTSKISTITRQKVQSLFFYPQTDNAFIAVTTKGAYRIDVAAKTMDLMQGGAGILAKVSGNNLYMVAPSASAATSSQLITFDLVLNNQTSDSPLPFPRAGIKNVIEAGGRNAVLLSNGSLFLSDASGTSYSQIAHSAKLAEFANDGSKLLYQDDDGKTFVYLLKDELVALDAPAASVVKLNLINAQAIQNIWWTNDSFHLILDYSGSPDKIMLAEVTDKEPNEHFFIATSSRETFYNIGSKMLYLLGNGELSFLDTSPIQ